MTKAGVVVDSVFTPEAAGTVDAVDGDRYRLAAAVGVVVAVVSSALLAWLAGRTRLRTWPPLAQGLTAALLAALAGASALLVLLGIDPIRLLATW